MFYLKIRDCNDFLFDFALKFDKTEKTDHYNLNLGGVNKLEGILERIQWGFYKGFYEKASSLFLFINGGHLFINGNKRLALSLLLGFAFINGYWVSNVRKDVYKKWFKEHFPKYKLSRKRFKTVYRWAMYNFNRATADSRHHNCGFDDLKRKAESFLKIHLIKKVQ
ncbi:MAG: hypothetical protein KJ915_09515 [Candidatus Omnitrophica bacterium]|nr:hypothetical protein [Candidatus Omnitrophota bacterium]